MAWWEGVDETRLLIAPEVNAIGNDLGHFLSLRHPKSGNATCYLFKNGTLQELNWFKQSYGSWFLGDYVCEDGSLYTATTVDPVFIMLPIFEEARMEKRDDPGKFRQLDEIMFINGYPGYQHLISIAENCMQVVCDIKEIGSSKFFRLDDSKVLAWLCYKVHQLKQTLPALDKNYAARDKKDTLTDAISILGEYLKDEPWLKLLCNHLKLNLLDATMKAPVMEIHPTAPDSSLGSSNQLQVFFPVCDNNHWHVHVINIGASRVEILSSLPLTRGNNISAQSKRLTNAIQRAFHANGLLMHLKVSKFEHVQPDVVQQKNDYDCGMFAIKYMEHWNGGTLSQAVAEDKMNMYRLKLVVRLIMSEENKAREKFMEACEF